MLKTLKSILRSMTFKKDEYMQCWHTCSSDCRREGCNCECGEFHIGEEEQDDFSGPTPDDRDR